MSDFLTLPQEEREIYFKEAAERTARFSSIIYEKDFWVCLTLKKLFSLSGISEHLTFKGGTSLSKAYNIIKRFSEDVDVSIHRSYLGFSEEKDPEKITGSKKRDRMIEQLKNSNAVFIADELLPRLIEAFSDLGGNWKLKIDEKDPQTILFYYPTRQTTIYNSYINPFVKIELGARSDNCPQETRVVNSYLDEVFPDEVGRVVTAKIQTLVPDRTFWEKATILHAEYHRPADNDLPTRHSRHFYDLYCLAKLENVSAMAKDTSLMEKVVRHKKIFFRSGWANYDSAVVGSFKLYPKETQIKRLRNDYIAMEQMFFTEPPLFDDILEDITALEDEINNPF